MAIKVCIDAGHYGKYNRSPVLTSYYESEMTWKLSILLAKELAGYGILTTMTRTSQSKDLDLYSRGYKAKNHDLFVSLHSNAASSSSANYALCIGMVADSDTKIDEKSREISSLLAKAVGDTMGVSYQTMERKYDGDRDKDGKRDDEYYGVLYGAKAAGTPGVIIEHGFHTNLYCTKWLSSDDNLEKLAKAEAAVIAKYFGVAKVTVKACNGSVQVIYEGDDGLNIRKEPNTNSAVKKVAKYGEQFVVVGKTSDNKWYKLKDGLYVSANSAYVKYSSFKPYSAQVDIDNLIIRSGAGVGYSKLGYTGKGIFTIVAEKKGTVNKNGDVGLWGKLLSGTNRWICLNYTKKVG